MPEAKISKLPVNLSRYAKLSPAQAGHLRHFHNLISQPDGEWHHMGTQEPAQEFLDALRYQLATMTYAAGVAHFHRLPTLRSVFKPLIRRLIHKMLRREVWGYWFNASLSGNMTDPGRTELRKPWADPVVRENIMYSGHLLLMTSLYAMLFDDDEFEQPHSLLFHWNPLFFGLGPETFSYDTRSLQKAILAEMERNGWVGVCCEPNLVFVVCNQFPIIAMRYNDIRDGTNVVDGVLEKYKAAWEKKGMVSPNGLYVDFWMVKQDQLKDPSDLAWTAWAGAFMNAWRPEFVRSGYEKQAFGYITNIDGQVRLHPPAVGNAIRELVAKEDQDDASSSPPPPPTAALLAQAVEMAKAAASTAKSKMAYTKPTFGYVVQWLSELGRTTELDGLLRYADERLNPTWEHGGLFYPRHDVPVSPDMDWTHMDPFSGNAAIGYARLNVKDGQRAMWEQPWTPTSLAEKPWIDGLDGLADGVDFLRGTWDAEVKALIVTARSWNGRNRSISLVARNLEEGTWSVYVGEEVTKVVMVEGREGRRGDLTVEVEVGGDEVDIVFLNEGK